jgi:hypothetical protein
MVYFKHLQKLGRTLAAEAGKLLDSAKVLKNAIDQTLKSLKDTYTDEEIAENFEEDADWISDFTEQFLDDCNNLEKYCKQVMHDCTVRKETLDKAIIWG